jgi:alkylhydroperoxidase/carboxymuconolactone decarboxylase family protein YurZ
MIKQQNQRQIDKSRELLKDLKELRGGTLLPFHKKIANDPALLHAFIQQYINCNKTDTAIPRKYRELMIMLLGCAKNVETTVITHGKLAYENGATVEEIGEALRLAFLVCGSSAIIPAAELFDLLDEA